MATTPSSLQFTKEVQTTTIGDAAPTPAAGSLELFANQNDTFYVKTSAGVSSALISGASSVSASDSSLTISPTTGAVLAAVATNGVTTVKILDANVTDAKLANMAANTMKVNATAGSAVPTNLAITANTFPGRTSAGNLAAQGVTDAVLTWMANPTGINAAALGIAGLTGWVDVTQQSAPVLPGNSAATNNSNINTILSAAANGSTIYFPKGTYQFSAAWTMPNKMFTFQGQGSNRAGSPATAFTELRWIANVGGTLITLPGSGNGWYTQFRDLTFTASTADQASGAVIDVNGNVGTNIQNCSFQSAGTFFNDVLTGTGGNGSNSWNSAVIFNCSIQGYKGVGVRCNSSGSSLVIKNCVIQGNWGGFTGTPAANSALVGVSGGFVGAMQVIGCDILGNANNMLLNPVLASSEVCASVFCTNVYMDNSAGSCLKITGTGATVRATFNTCSFTTAGTNYTVGGTGLSAIEIGGSFTFTAGGQNISFDECNIYNTFGTVGTNNGVLINGTWADVYFDACKVSGWTNGYNVTPSGMNVSMLKVLGGACGPSGGYALNTTGFNILGGTYKGLVLQGVNAHGNTTNLTLGAVTVAAADASLFRITDNTGINPRGAVTTPGVPTAGTTVTNTTGFRVWVGTKNGATAPTNVVYNGVTIGAGAFSTVITTGANAFVLDPGGTISFTTTTIATWTWVAN